MRPSGSQQRRNERAVTKDICRILTVFGVIDFKFQRAFIFWSRFIKMPPKKGKSKMSFKIFSTENYSKFVNRFPFLEERQIKAKLLQAWRNRFTSETKKAKGEFKIPKHQNEDLFNEGKTDLVFFHARTNIGWCCVISLGN